MVNKKIVISGADGFVGSNLVKYLAKNGYEIYAIVLPNNKATEKIRKLDSVHIVEGTLDQFEKLSLSLPNNPLAFIHFAWIGVSQEKRNDIIVQKENIDLLINAIELANKLGSTKFIFPGSTFEFCYSGQLINRKTVPSPIDAYGTIKIAARYIAQNLCNKYEIDFVYAVISGIYSEERLDNNVITYTIKSLLHSEKPSLSNLEQKWGYVHINDVVNAFELIIKYGKNDGFYVIGHGDNWPLYKYIYTIRDIINPNLPLGIGEIPYSNNRIPMSCVDLSEIKNDTGYVPKISFEKGIKLMIDKFIEMERENGI